jgi:serine/threonine protein kinase
MGAVYIAVAYGAEGFRRTFVVKRLRAELSREPELVDQFIDEARMGSTLVHSNIVPVFDFGKVGDEYYMAQEYILGRDMEKLTAKSLAKWGRALPPSFVFYAAQQVLQALSYAHTRLDNAGQPSGLVHRDVSPQNVLVSARGEVKLFDFGIVKSNDRKTQTAAGVVKGNVSYMAPEQARGRELDGRADLFSLSLVMYRCLSGEILYQGETTYDMLVHAAGGLTPEDWAKVRALPEPAASLLKKALATDPGERFQTAMEFAAALPPLPPSAAQDAAAVVQSLFGDEIKAETTRLNQLDKGTT